MKKCPECGADTKEQDGSVVCSDGCGWKAPKGKKDSSDLVKVSRQDVRDLCWDMNTEPLHQTPEGFLRGRASVTNIGIFPYILSDGTVRNELRLPEEVFSSDSLNSLKGKPITLDHPLERVTADNVGELGIGSIGDVIYEDPYRVYAPVVIHREDGVSAVQGGKVALSCGYDADLEFTPGNYLGQDYDAIQRNIRYNHVALVDKGRAGDDAVLRIDGVDGYHSNIKKSQTGHNDKSKKGERKMRKLIIDGAQFEVDELVHQELVKANNRADTAQVDLDQVKLDHASELNKLQGELDNHKDRADKAEADLEKQKGALSPEEVEAAVQARMDTIAVAVKAGVQVDKADSSEDIQKKVIVSVFPSTKLDTLEDKPKEYLQARYDGAVEYLEAESDQDRKNRHDAAELPPNNLPNDRHPTHVDAAETARQRMIDNMNKPGTAEK